MASAEHTFHDYGRPQSSNAERLSKDANAPWNSTKWRIDLPLGVMPQFSSLRVQKAYRLNEIEGIRLQRRLQILDSQRVHADRLVNQDIRLTKGALEHIEASTGSAEQSNPREADESLATSELSTKPMFLYGERLVSRKVNRYRRSQSAAVVADWKRKKDNASLTQTPRPKTAAPHFQAIKEKVQRKIIENPEYDPNTDLSVVRFAGV